MGGLAPPDPEIAECCQPAEDTEAIGDTVPAGENRIECISSGGFGRPDAMADLRNVAHALISSPKVGPAVRMIVSISEKAGAKPSSAFALAVLAKRIGGSPTRRER